MADDPYPLITYGGVGAGVTMWDHTGTEFTNVNRVIEDEAFEAVGDVDPNLGDPGIVLAQNRVIPDAAALLQIFNGAPVKSYFTGAGHLVLVVPVWRDQLVEGVSFRPGVTSPTFQVYRGNVRGEHWASGDQGHTNIQINHDWFVASAVWMHVHIGLRAAAAAQAFLRFDMEYILGQNGQVDDAPVVISTGDVDISSLPQYSEIQIDFPSIDMTGFLESCNITFMLERVAAAANDYANGNAEALLKSGDLHIQLDKWGTFTRAPGSGP